MWQATAGMAETVSHSTPHPSQSPIRAMMEPISDEHLRFALGNALRGLRLLPTGRVLTEDDRHEIEFAILKQLKVNKWTVVAEPF
jgi:hypothetical protein